MLREGDADERAVADALGQKTIEMAGHDAKDADLTPKMGSVVAQFGEKLNGRGAKSVSRTAKHIKPARQAKGAAEMKTNFSEMNGTAGWARTTDLRSHNPTL